MLEAGAGNGMNFAHYPPEVTHVLAVEPEPHLRALAQGKAKHTQVPIEVVDGTADRPPADDRDKEIARLVDLGATRGPDHDEYGHTWAVMSDPESNEFCIAGR